MSSAISNPPKPCARSLHDADYLEHRPDRGIGAVFSSRGSSLGPVGQAFRFGNKSSDLVVIVSALDGPLRLLGRPLFVLAHEALELVTQQHLRMYGLGIGVYSCVLGASAEPVERAR